MKTVRLQVKPHLLLKPDVSLPTNYKPKRSIQLFDRVVVVKTTYMVSKRRTYRENKYKAA